MLCLAIGGENKVVEIDESKFGKRKYNRGHYIGGQWVFGGVECESGNSFLIPVQQRNEETLLPVIQKFILPGLTIISDCWRAYAKLDKHNYKHLTVNHSQGFKDTITGACTNKIEGLWTHAKHCIPHYHRQNQNYTVYLAKFMFLSRIQHSKLEPVKEFCKRLVYSISLWMNNFDDTKRLFSLIFSSLLEMLNVWCLLKHLVDKFHEKIYETQMWLFIWSVFKTA